MSGKIGEGHAWAMWPQGLRELRGMVYPESNVAQPSEYGLYGTLTPGEVAESRRHEMEPDEEPRNDSILQQKLRDIDSRKPPEQGRDEPREPEPER